MFIPIGVRMYFRKRCFLSECLFNFNKQHGAKFHLGRDCL